jgi:K+-sensing histidine kinase KdpD
MKRGLFVPEWILTQRLQMGVAPVVPYAFAIICLTAALGLSLLFEYFGFREMALQLFGVAIVVIGWYSGHNALTLAVILSVLGYNYFFTEPRYSLEISREDLPTFFVFAVWSAIVGWFVSVRRRIETDLTETGNRLRLEVEQRKRREAEIHHLNEELEKRAEQLTASNKELEAFAYSVSHDLRAPLRHSAGYAELLQKHANLSLDDKSRRYLKSILDASKRMGTLIDDLLAFSRIGRVAAKYSLVNLNQLAQETITEIAELTKGREIAWKIGQLPVCHGDRSML